MLHFLFLLQKIYATMCCLFSKIEESTHPLVICACGEGKQPLSGVGRVAGLFFYLQFCAFLGSFDAVAKGFA